MFIIGGNERWRYLKGTSCKYAVTLNKSIWFTSTNKVSEDNYVNLKKTCKLMKKIIFIIIIFINSNLNGKEYDLIFNFSGSYKTNE